MRVTTFGTCEPDQDLAARLRSARDLEDEQRERARKERGEGARAALARSHQESDRMTRRVLAAAARAIGAPLLAVEKDRSCYADAKALAGRIQRLVARQAAAQPGRTKP